MLDVEEKDMGCIKALKKLLKEGSFELKGTAVPQFLGVYNWLNDLEIRFDRALKPKVKKGKKK